MQINTGAILAAALQRVGGTAPTRFVAAIFFVHHDGETIEFVWADDLNYLSGKIAQHILNGAGELHPFRNIVGLDVATMRVLRTHMLVQFFDDVNQEAIQAPPQPPQE